MPGQEKMCLSPFIHVQHERKYIFSKARENVHYNTKSQENEPMSLAILLAGRSIFRKGLMSHEDKSRENIPSAKCYYMYTISQFIKSCAGQ